MCDGLCSNATDHRRSLGGSSSAAATELQFCGKDAHPVAGKKYWVVGNACTDHADECDCELMMPPDAFSICVWALLLASIIAPIGFGATLRNKLKRAESASKPASGKSESATELDPAERSNPAEEVSNA